MRDQIILVDVHVPLGVDGDSVTRSAALSAGNKVDQLGWGGNRG